MPAWSSTVAEPCAAWDDPLTGHLPGQWLPPVDYPQPVVVAAEPSHCPMAGRHEEKPGMAPVAKALVFSMPELMIAVPLGLLAVFLTVFLTLSARLSAAFDALQF